MKIINTFLVFFLLFLLVSYSECLFRKKRKIKKRQPAAKNVTELINGVNRTVTYITPKAVNITDPLKTPLFQFALGVADILTSDPKAAQECQLQHWMIDQPTIQEGTADWYAELTVSLSQLKNLIDVYALQPVCTKASDKLKGWLGPALEKENERYLETVKQNKTYDNIDYPDPYRNQSQKLPDRNNTRRRRVFLSKSKAKSRSKLKNKLKKNKDWWGVLSLSLPLVPYHILKYKLMLDKMMKGFIFIQFNQFIECIARSINTNRAINDRLVGYKSLMEFQKNGNTMSEFGNWFSLLLCNWNRFIDHIKSLEAGNSEKDPMKKWFHYGQAMGKLVVAVSTATDTLVLYNNKATTTS